MGVFDDMICSRTSRCLSPSSAFQISNGEGNAGGSIHAKRLDDDVFQWQMRKMQGYKLGLAGRGDNIDVVDGHAVQKPIPSKLQHGALAHHLEKLLGQDLRLSGQNLVPEPPAMIRAIIFLPLYTCTSRG